MKKYEFERLKEGDIVVVNRGRDLGRMCEVVYIDYRNDSKYGALLIRSCDRKFLRSAGSHGNLALTTWNQINMS